MLFSFLARLFGGKSNAPVNDGATALNPLGKRRAAVNRTRGASVLNPSCDNVPVAGLWCHKHNKPIIKLDAFYPYHSEKNCCEDCLRQFKRPRG